MSWPVAFFVTTILVRLTFIFHLIYWKISLLIEFRTISINFHCTLKHKYFIDVENAVSSIQFIGSRRQHGRMGRMEISCYAVSYFQFLLLRSLARSFLIKVSIFLISPIIELWWKREINFNKISSSSIHRPFCKRKILIWYQSKVIGKLLTTFHVSMLGQWACMSPCLWRQSDKS